MPHSKAIFMPYLMINKINEYEERLKMPPDKKELRPKDGTKSNNNNKEKQEL